MKFTRTYNLDDSSNTTLPFGSFKKGESVEFDLEDLRARGININSEEEFDRHYGFAFKPVKGAKPKVSDVKKAADEAIASGDLPAEEKKVVVESNLEPPKSGGDE